MEQPSPEALADLKGSLDLVKNDGADSAPWQEVFKTLRKHAAEGCKNLVNDKAGRNYTLLHFAGSFGNEAACRSLVDEFGADPSIQTGRGETPGDLARRRGHESLAEQFTAWATRGQKRTPPWREQGQAPKKKPPWEVAPSQVHQNLDDDAEEEEAKLPKAIEDLEYMLIELKTAEEAPWDEVYNLLREHKNNREFVNLVNDRAGRNYNLLHFAALQGNSLACETLIHEHGADVIVRTDTGATASELASRRGFEDLSQELRDLEKDTEEQLKKHLANVKAEGDKDEVWADVYEFLSQNKVVNNMAGLNYGFLHHAASWGNTAACRNLIEKYSADPFMRTPKKRELPEDIAKKREHSWTERMLNSFAQGEARNYMGNGRSKAKKPRLEPDHQPQQLAIGDEAAIDCDDGY